MKMRKVTFEELDDRIGRMNFKEKFDLVIAIGKGGIIPGSMIAHRLGIDMKIVWLSFRDENNEQAREEPALVRDLDFDTEDLKRKRVLIVDDVARTGKTMQKAKEILDLDEVTTFVIGGRADYALYRNEDCFEFPWSRKGK